MKYGLLWYDKYEGRTQAERIERAADYYTTEYGKRPTLCFVHPTAGLGGGIIVEGIEIRYTNSVLPGHYWLGEG